MVSTVVMQVFQIGGEGDKPLWVRVLWGWNWVLCSPPCNMQRK